jgi:regulation of enolase protein 1 (concanavalin A-like superfamily)
VNLLSDLTPEILSQRGLAWENPPLKWDTLPGGGMHVTVQPRCDFFRDPAGVNNKADAPYLWTRVSGDFVAVAHFRPAFTTHWDAGAILARIDSEHWAKLCFEKTDLGTTAAVSVVTRVFSDDANGANLSTPDLWLQLLRMGDVFGMHYSLDGQHWQMVRKFNLPCPEAIQVGVVAQCPAGPGTTLDILHFSIEPRRAQNLRAGV